MKRHIIFAFLLVFLVYCLGSAVIIQNLLSSTASLQTLISLHEIEDIRQNLNLRVQKIQSFVHLSALDFSYNLDAIVANIDGMDHAVHGCYGCHHDAAVNKEIHYTEQLLTDYQEKLSYLITSGREGEWRRVNQQQAEKIAETITYRIQDMVNRAAASLQRKTDMVMQQIRKTYLFMGVTLICSLLVMGVIARHLAKKVLTPVQQLLVATQRLADGDLGYITESQGKDEFFQLQQNFNTMSLSLASQKKENESLTQALQRKIDELQNTKDQLVTAEKLASLGKLAGGISHDFNNILCGILGYISLLKRQVSNDKTATETLKAIENASRHAAQLVAKLQSFANSKECPQHPVNLNEVVVAVQQALGGQSCAKPFRVRLDLDDDLSMVMGDFAGLKELLCGVCENAVEAISENGCIEIKTENIPALTLPEAMLPMADQPCVRVSVKDNGKGISEGDLKKIFDPYFSTKEMCSQRGMGLGMAIAFSLVKQHNGQICIDSKEGSGTQVDVYFPALRGTS
ncbi:MAG: ATP-binding protein [Desulfobulbaceae bacterium]|nr:ATP-binding protein [Desulfobulbaceae bacterium]